MNLLIIRTVKIFIVNTVIIHLVITFIVWDINPEHWNMFINYHITSEGVIDYVNYESMRTALVFILIYSLMIALAFGNMIFKKTSTTKTIN